MTVTKKDLIKEVLEDLDPAQPKAKTPKVIEYLLERRAKRGANQRLGNRPQL